MFYDDYTSYNDDYSEQFDVRQPLFQEPQGFFGGVGGGSFQQGFRQGYRQGYRQGFRDGRRSCPNIGFPGFGPGPY